MKRMICLLAAMLVFLGALSGCTAPDTGSGKLSVVVTVFPEFDWLMNVLGERHQDVDVTLLLDSKIDMHNYQPTVEDIMKISTCDLFIYVGGESDKWVDAALKQSSNPDMVTLCMMDVLGDALHEEEMAEGMQGEEEDEDDDGGPEYDEHVWLSIRNAAALTGRIGEAMAEIDPENAETYRQNAMEYRIKLADLDSAYAGAIGGAEVKTLLFGDRFPFRYLTEDYKLDYYAAFMGCSAETEASFATITFLAGKVDELRLKHIMIIEGSDGRIAESIRQNTSSGDQTILTLDSMQSLNRNDWEKGVNYLSVMESNLEVLKQALR